MEKEKVLEIEAQEVFDRVAIRIKYQNFEVLKRGEFEDRGIGVVSFNNPCYLPSPYNQLHLKGKSKIEDNSIFTVAKEEFKNIKNMVEAINEKYGIPKRWRAKENDCYYTIFGENIEKKSLADDKFYNLGNYFKTKEEAQKVKEELDKFWAKVRAGEIGEEAADWEEEDEKD
ncbi:hypothetical protein ABVN59_05155 [Fusobacterium vincentii]|uniref:hypothetical protein n=1 Tax=Fusobacterium TaxID=848 RepID=UPI0003B8071D|nr:hypothetical protein [Fusobacterium nucleatum]ERT44826.1 hypothetical protein HMPREF1768_01773 [Fusobacterium nucleatum CTI-7]